MNRFYSILISLSLFFSNQAMETTTEDTEKILAEAERLACVLTNSITAPDSSIAEIEEPVQPECPPLDTCRQQSSRTPTPQPTPRQETQPAQDEDDLDFELIKSEDILTQEASFQPCSRIIRAQKTTPIAIPTRKVFESSSLIKRIKAGQFNGEDVRHQNELAMIIQKCLNQNDIDSLIEIINTSCLPTQQLQLYNPLILTQTNLKLQETLRQIHTSYTNTLEEQIVKQAQYMNKLFLDFKSITLRFAESYENELKRQTLKLDDSAIHSDQNIDRVYKTLQKLPRLSQTLVLATVPHPEGLQYNHSYIQRKEDTQRLIADLTAALGTLQTVRPLQLEQ